MGAMWVPPSCIYFFFLFSSCFLCAAREGAVVLDALTTPTTSHPLAVFCGSILQQPPLSPTPSVSANNTLPRAHTSLPYPALSNPTAGCPPQSGHPAANKRSAASPPSGRFPHANDPQQENPCSLRKHKQHTPWSHPLSTAHGACAPPPKSDGFFWEPTSLRFATKLPTGASPRYLRNGAFACSFTCRRSSVVGNASLDGHAHARRSPSPR